MENANLETANMLQGMSKRAHDMAEGFEQMNYADMAINFQRRAARYAATARYLMGVDDWSGIDKDAQIRAIEVGLIQDMMARNRDYRTLGRNMRGMQ